MKTVLNGLIAAGITAAFVASPGAAQQKALGINLSGAYFQSGVLAKSDATGSKLELGHRGAGSGSLEYWFGGYRVGLRADGAYTKAPFRIEGGSTSQENFDIAAISNSATYFGNVDLMIRLLSPSMDRRFSPFISVGGGAVKWDHENDTYATNMSLILPSLDTQIEGDSQTQLAAFGSIGTDVLFTKNFGLRLEAKDYWNPKSPYIQASQINSSGNRHQIGGHNLLWTGGLQFFFGGPKEKAGFIAAAPEPAPVVVEAPAPPPAPTTEAVNMCYVDANGRLQTIAATRNLSNSNVYVTQNGSDVLFSTAYPTTEPLYIKGANWYVASRPMILDLGNGTAITTDVDVNTVPNRVEFVNFGSAMPLSSSDLTYVGSINGTPLYARSSDIGDFRSELDTAMRTTTDLGRMLADKAFADRYTNAITTFYMPVEPGTSCMFQPVSSTHVVRRTRG